MASSQKLPRRNQLFARSGDHGAKGVHHKALTDLGKHPARQQQKRETVRLVNLAAQANLTPVPHCCVRVLRAYNGGGKLNYCCNDELMHRSAVVSLSLRHTNDTRIVEWKNDYFQREIQTARDARFERARLCKHTDQYNVCCDTPAK